MLWASSCWFPLTHSKGRHSVNTPHPADFPSCTSYTVHIPRILITVSIIRVHTSPMTSLRMFVKLNSHASYFMIYAITVSGKHLSFSFFLSFFSSPPPLIPSFLFCETFQYTLAKLLLSSFRFIFALLCVTPLFLMHSSHFLLFFFF